MTATMTMKSLVAMGEIFGYDIVVNGDTRMFDLYMDGLYIYSREW